MHNVYFILIRITAAILNLIIAISCTQGPHYGSEINDALKRLDDVMLRQNEIRIMKEKRIDSLQAVLGKADSPETAYQISKKLYDEYEKWNVDSAFSCAHRKASLASLIDKNSLKAEAAIDLANSYCLSGMYNNALSSLAQIELKDLEGSNLLHKYHYLWYEIYHGICQETRDSAIYHTYKVMEEKALEICDMSIMNNVIEYYNTKANVYLRAGRHDEVLALMNHGLAQPELSGQDRAMLQYWKAKTYNSMGNKRMALLNYAEGARIDFLTPVKTYGSPILVTKMCFEAGDLKRAFRYYLRNFADAHDMNSRYRLNIIDNIGSKITIAYQRLTSRRARQLTVLVVGLWGLLTVICILLLLQFKGRIRLREANRIKDAYLGQFVSMFSEHINSLERYRSRLRVTAKQMDFHAIQQELRSDSFVDGEWAALLERFDNSFLGLFPDFPEQLNCLLKPDKRINLPSVPGKLSNEIRVFALIRLGVSDSKQIAKILRLSVSTVYNYRVKLRNAALDDRDGFEERIMKIGA